MSIDHQGSTWITPLTNPEKLTQIVRYARYDLSLIEFDAIAVRGLSGLLIGPIVAQALKKHLVVVRKADDSTHSDYRVEGAIGQFKYMILDDLIDTGATVYSILSAMSKWRPEATCVGSYFWQYPPNNYNSRYEYHDRIRWSAVKALPILNDYNRDQRRERERDRKMWMEPVW